MGDPAQGVVLYGRYESKRTTSSPIQSLLRANRRRIGSKKERSSLTIGRPVTAQSRRLKVRPPLHVNGGLWLDSRPLREIELI
jgi:hypothetical protein